MKKPTTTAEFTHEHLKVLLSSMKKKLLPPNVGVALIVFDEGKGELDVKFASTANGHQSREILNCVLNTINNSLKNLN